MKVSVAVGGDRDKSSLEIQAFCATDPEQMIWALKKQLKAAQLTWPNEMGDLMIANKFKRKEVTSEGK